jgi:hypothetical protein
MHLSDFPAALTNSLEMKMENCHIATRLVAHPLDSPTLRAGPAEN